MLLSTHGTQDSPRQRTTRREALAWSRCRFGVLGLLHLPSLLACRLAVTAVVPSCSEDAMGA